VVNCMFGTFQGTRLCNMASSGKNNSNPKRQGKKDKNSEKLLSNDTHVAFADSGVHNCCICEDSLSSSDVCLKCSTCRKLMHSTCWDPDAPAQVYEYLSNISSDACIRIYCPHCVTSPNSDILTKIDEKIDEKMKKFEERINSTLRAFGEHSCDRTYANAVTSESTLSSPSVQARPFEPQPKPSDIQNEISEAMEQERRKRNIVVFNMQSSQAGDTNRLTALFEHLTGTRPPSFRSRRIGKPIPGKMQPILVEFASEFDRADILHSARKLKDLQAEWPHIGIAPDRTKLQLEQYRQQRSSGNTRIARSQQPRTDANPHLSTENNTLLKEVN
jgi:hypothetical protein